MGTVFSSIPGVGARNTWEIVGSAAAAARHVAYQNFRWHEIKFAAQRATQVYVAYGPMGDGSGGGGLGTFASPYLVRGLVDFSDLVASVLSGIPNLGIILLDDIVLYGDPSNTDQSVTIDWANISLGRSFTGTNRPEITGFVPVSGGAAVGSRVGVATSAGGGIVNVVADAPSLVIYWVRGRLPSSTNRDDYKLQPYKKAASLADCDANPFSFFSDGTGFRVNIGPDGPTQHDINTLEASCTTGGGIHVTDVNDVAVDDLIVEGFNLNAVFASGGGQCIRFEQTGTNVAISRRCKARWGPYHTVAHIASTAGGIVTWHQCEIGFHTWDASDPATVGVSGGGGDACVNYNANGGHECGRYDCWQDCGGLDGTDLLFSNFDAAFFAAYAAAHGSGQHWGGYGNIRPDNPHGFSSGTPYAHTTTAATYPTYLAEINCRWRGIYGVPIQNDHVCGTVPAVSNLADQTQYRVYVCNRLAETYTISPDAMCGVFDRWNPVVSKGPGTGAFEYICAAGALVGVFLNLEIKLVAKAGTWTGKSLRFFNSGAHKFHWIHMRLRATGVNHNQLAMMWKSGANNLNACTIYNGVASVESGITAANFNLTAAAGTDHFSEQSPGAGGILGLAQWGVQSTQVDGLTGVVGLAAAATWGTALAVPANCRNASKALPASIDCFQDFLGAVRNPDQTKRSLGTIEANPYAGPTSGTRVRWPAEETRWRP